MTKTSIGESGGLHFSSSSPCSHSSLYLTFSIQQVMRDNKRHYITVRSKISPFLYHLVLFRLVAWSLSLIRHCRRAPRSIILLSSSGNPDHGYAIKEGCRTERKSHNLEYVIGVRLTRFTTQIAVIFVPFNLDIRVT
jgi:hypothetical protein